MYLDYKKLLLKIRIVTYFLIFGQYFSILKNILFYNLLTLLCQFFIINCIIICKNYYINR